MAEIHNGKRGMPAILSREAVDTWLTGTPEQTQTLLQPYPSARMRAHPVSTRVNASRNNDPNLLEPVEP